MICEKNLKEMGVMTVARESREAKEESLRTVTAWRRLTPP